MNKVQNVQVRFFFSFTKGKEEQNKVHNDNDQRENVRNKKINAVKPQWQTK